MRYMYSKHPKMAKEFVSKTKDFGNLPEQVKAIKHKMKKKYA